MSEQLSSLAETQQPAQPGVSHCLFTRLKEGTQASHQALEHRLALSNGNLDRNRYRNLLQRFYGFYLPWEGLLAAWVGELLPGREKVPLLMRDLAYLGSNIGAIPLCPFVPAVNSQAEAFGSMYVMEGSTLGGQLISRHLEKSLSFSNGDGYRFFRSYGPEVGRRWKNFQSIVLAHSVESEYTAIVSAAEETFRCLSDWLMPKEESNLCHER